MNFADERWVKLYTRDTTNWKLLPFESKCLLLLLLRKVDRSGQIDVGANPIRAIAVNTDAPVEFVEAALAGLLAADENGEPTVSLNGRTLTIVNFESAQDARMSGRLRQKLYMARRRENDEPSPIDNETSPISDGASRKVTRSDTVLRGVTRSDDQIRLDQNRTESESVREAPAPGSMTSPPRTRRERGTRLPDGWVPSPKVCEDVHKLGLDPESIRGPFTDHWQSASGERAWKVNWDSAFRLWARNEIKFQERRSGPMLRVVDQTTKSAAYREYVPAPPASPPTQAELESLDGWLKNRKVQ